MRADGLFPERMSLEAQRSALNLLDRAMKKFFRRIELGQKAGYPRFRPRSRYNSITWAARGGAKLKDDRLRVRGVGALRIRWHRAFPIGAEIRSITILRQDKRWYVSFALAMPDAIQKATNKNVGVDRGVTVPFALSTGELIQGSRAGKNGQPAARRAQRKMSRRKRGGNRYRKASLLHARHKQRQANRRKDFLHKFSRYLVNNFDLIAFEDLNVVAMTRSARGTIANPGRGVRRKSVLNREILDQGWSMLVQMTIYKAEEAGRSVVKVPAPYTSQTCFECGSIDKKSRSGTIFRCTTCGHQDHADTNAAKNILRAGLALQALTMSEEARVA
jgi:putative transposase